MPTRESAPTDINDSDFSDINVSSRITRNSLSLIDEMDDDFEQFEKSLANDDNIGSYDDHQYEFEEKDDESVWEDYKDMLNAHYSQDEPVGNERTGHCFIATAVLIVIGVMISTVCLFVVQAKPDRGENAMMMKSGASRVPLAPSNIREKCSDKHLSTQAGWEECNVICLPASCCFEPHGKKDSCLDSEYDVCEQYITPCHTVLQDSSAAPNPFSLKSGDPTITEVSPAPYDIAEICSPDNILTLEGFTKCHEKCLSAECCWSPSFTKNCLAADDSATVATCLQYAPCSIVNVDKANPIAASRACTVAPTNISQNDRQETPNVKKNSSRDDVCRAACAAAACCFPGKFPHGLTDCSNDNLSLWCDQFSFCEATLTAWDEAEADGIREACTAQLKSSGYEACSKVCHLADCQEEGEEEREWCEPCYFLFDDNFVSPADSLYTLESDSDSDSDSDETTPEVIVPPSINVKSESLRYKNETMTNITDYNNETTTNITDYNNETTTNITDYNKETTTNITDYNGETTTNITDYNNKTTTNITDYNNETTTNITDTVIAPVVMDAKKEALLNDVRDKCSRDHISNYATGHTTCQNLCMKRRCCFRPPGPGNCRSDKKEWCDEFSPCLNLRHGESK